MSQLISSLRASRVAQVGFALILLCHLSFGATSTPVLNTLSPSSTAAGSAAFTLHVYGGNYTRKSVVQWNGATRSTTLVSSGEIKAAITTADVQTSRTVSITVRDTRTNSVSSVSAFTVTAATPAVQPLSITTATLPGGAVASQYSATLAASGGTQPYSWKLSSGTLPPGLALATNGSISGQATTAGNSTFYVQALDSATSPQAATSVMAISIAPPALKITTTTLPSGTISAPYSSTLLASGGTLPYTWSITSGQLPSGVGLAASTGIISGTPAVSGSFPVTVRVTDGASATASLNLGLSVATSSTGFTRFFSDTSFWNTPIGLNPQIDANSAAMISKAVVAYAGNANFANTDSWGIGLADATSTSKTYTVLCTKYCTGDTINFPIPAGALPTTGSDHHLAVVYGTKELDMWQALYNSTNDGWSASSRMTNDVSGWGASCAQGLHCNGAVAAGFALLGGAVRPEEISQGHIDHALSITTPYTRAAYIACPATHQDGKYADSAALPEGARIQLDPSFNVDAQAWPAWEKVIAKALQTYGAYVSDTSGSLAIRGVTDMNLGTHTWSSANTPKGGSLNNLPWSSFRVIQIQSCN